MKFVVKDEHLLDLGLLELPLRVHEHLESNDRFSLLNRSRGMRQTLCRSSLYTFLHIESPERGRRPTCPLFEKGDNTDGLAQALRP